MTCLYRHMCVCIYIYIYHMYVYIYIYTLTMILILTIIAVIPAGPRSGGAGRPCACPKNMAIYCSCARAANHCTEMLVGHVGGATTQGKLLYLCAPCTCIHIVHHTCRERVAAIAHLPRIGSEIGPRFEYQTGPVSVSPQLQMLSA